MRARRPTAGIALSRTAAPAAAAALVAALAAACSFPKSNFTATEDAAGSATPDGPLPLALVVTPQSLDVDEGKSTTFTVALNRAPGAPVQVSISTTSSKVGLDTPTLTFDDTDFAAAQTIKVSGLQDPDAVDDVADIAVALTGVAGVTPVTVRTTVHDDDKLAIVTDISPTTNTVGVLEGASVDVHVHLSAMPTGDTAITATLGQGPVQITPSMNVYSTLSYGTDQIFTISGTPDANAVDEDVTLTFSGPAGSGIQNAVYTIHVTDRDTLAISAQPSKLDVTEGATGATLGVSLTQQPTATVTVTLSAQNHLVNFDHPTLTFTTTNYATAQSVVVSAPSDPDTVGGSDTILLDATGVAGIAEQSVGVTTHDPDVQAIVTDATPPVGLKENGTATFDVHLAYKPAGPITVSVSSLAPAVATATPGTITFDPTTYATPVTVTVHGTDDANLVTDTTSIRLQEASIGTVDVAVAVTDDDVQTILLGKTTDTIMEPQSDGNTVKLGYDPGGTVTVTLASSDPSTLTVSPASLTFDSTNYGTAKAVTMTAVDDPDADSADVTITASGAAAPVSPTAIVHVIDDDVLAIAANASGIVSINEGGGVDVRVHLTAKPDAPVTVTPTFATGTSISVSPTSASFTPTNYATDQIFHFAAAHDANAASEDIPVSLVPSATGMMSVGFTLRTIDSDTLNILLSKTGSAQMTEQGAPLVVGVSLTAQPTADTVVTISTSNAAAVAVGTASLTFTTTNWSTVQNVQLTAPADPDTVNGAATITFASSPLTPQTLAITVIDDDVQAIVDDASGFTVTEGQSGTFKVWLAFQPIAPTTIQVSSLNPSAATATPATLTFDATNYATKQTVTVTGVQDQNLKNEATSVKLYEPTIGTTLAAVTVIDDDTQKIVLTPSTLTVQEGSTGTFTAALQFDPGGPVTVTVTSSNATSLPVSPASINFDSTNYSTPVTVTVSAPVDSNTTSETSTITVAGGGASASVAATAQDHTVLATYGWPPTPAPFTDPYGVLTGQVFAYRISVTASTTLDALGVNVPSATGTYRMALYTANGSVPDQLIAESAPIALGNGANTASVAPGPTILQGTYFIALRISSTAGVNVSSNSGQLGWQCLRAQNINQIATDFPTSFGTANCTNDSLFNLWIATHYQQ